MSDSIGTYLNEIGKVALLTATRRSALSRTIEAGREAQERLDAGEQGRRPAAGRRGRRRAAKDRFIRANLRLVVSIARKYPRPRAWTSST